MYRSKLHISISFVLILVCISSVLYFKRNQVISLLKFYSFNLRKTTSIFFPYPEESSIVNDTKLVNNLIVTTKSEIPNFTTEINSSQSITKFINDLDLDINTEIQLVLTDLPQPWYQQIDPDNNNKVIYSVGVKKGNNQAVIFMHLDKQILEHRYEGWEKVLQKTYNMQFMEGLALLSNTQNSEIYSWSEFSDYYESNFSKKENIPLIVVIDNET